MLQKIKTYFVNIHKIKNSVTREQFINFIRHDNEALDSYSRATAHYVEFYERFMRKGKVVSWNWAALFGAPWALYRRMYIIAVGLGGLERLTGRFAEFVVSKNMVSVEVEILEVLFFVTFLCLWASLADYAYLSYTIRKIASGVDRKKPHNKIVMIAILMVLWGALFYFGVLRF